jgi:hypothetical protein
MTSASTSETPVPGPQHAEATAAATLRAERFGTLPARIPLARTVESHPAAPPNDPRFGRDPDNDWLVRYCA